MSNFFLNTNKIISIFPAYSLIARNEDCRDIEGLVPSNCLKWEIPESSCKDSCSSHESCFGYRYESDTNPENYTPYCNLYISDKICPLGWSLMKTSSTAKTMNDLVAQPIREDERSWYGDYIVCYGKNLVNL